MPIIMNVHNADYDRICSPQNHVLQAAFMSAAASRIGGVQS